MKQISLLRNFMLNAVVNSIAWSVLLGLIIFFIAPVFAWFITRQWTWASCDNVSKGKMLLSIPFALVMAGGNTLVLWHERTDMPLKWKFVVWAVVFGILGGIGFRCVEIINALFPH